MRQTKLFTSSPIPAKKAHTATKSFFRIDIVSLRLVKEKSVPYTTKQLNSPEKVVELLNCILDFKNFDREAVVVIPVDTKLHPLGINIAHIGSLTESIAHTREIFKYAILVNAYAIFLAHNHPSGDPKPSHHDCNLTKTVKQAGDILGIKLIDHIIIAGDLYFSFKENQMI